MLPIIRCWSTILLVVAALSANVALPAELHHALIGFNLGYPDRVNYFEHALSEIEQLGVRDVRIYEVFDGRRGVEHQARLKGALDRVLAHNMRPLLSLSNVPAHLQPSDEEKRLLVRELPARVAQKIEQALTYTNRFPPANWDAYRASIQELLDFLFHTYGRKRVLEWTFEIGNEPDAPLYFWGRSDQFAKLYSTAFDVLVANGIKEVGGFGSTHHPVFMSSVLKRSADYRALLEESAGNTARMRFLSFHLYERENSLLTPLAGLPSWISSTNFPVMITEWNVSSRGDVAAKTVRQRGAWGASFISLLADCARHGIDRLYVFKLMDYPLHQTMQLGAFERAGKPKSWFSEFAAIYSVVRDGYRVIDDESSLTLEGKNGSRIVMATGRGPIALSTSSSLLYSPFESAISEDKVRANQWAVVSSQQGARLP